MYGNLLIKEHFSFQKINKEENNIHIILKVLEYPKTYSLTDISSSYKKQAVNKP